MMSYERVGGVRTDARSKMGLNGLDGLDGLLANYLNQSSSKNVA